MAEIYRDVKKLIQAQKEEELTMPAHLLEYDHRYDEYASSIQNPGRVIAVDLPSKL